MESEGKYIISLIRGRSDLIRIPSKLIEDINLTNPITVRVQLPNERILPVRINPIDRTMTGLGPWLGQNTDYEKYSAICLTIVDRNPLSLSVDFTEETSHSALISSRIERPQAGMYLGSKLKSEFYEIIQTNEPIVMNVNFSHF